MCSVNLCIQGQRQGIYWPNHEQGTLWRVVQGKFSDYFAVVLTLRESRRWHHTNPDMREWNRGRIGDGVRDRARAQGYSAWAVFDVDEGLLRQTVV